VFAADAWRMREYALEPPLGLMPLATFVNDDGFNMLTAT
jgi:hypothetical protein